MRAPLQVLGALAALGVLASALALGVPACGTGGEESNGGMVGLPSAGLGPFRRLDTAEVSGRLGVRSPGLVESGMVLRGAGADQLLFYAAAEVPPDVPAPDAGTDVDAGAPEPDLAQFLPRRIVRTNLGPGPSYSGGFVVLEASEAWEGGAVYDPWAIVLPSGRVRLYYAGAGGIGIAEADSATGTFTRVGGAPVLTDLRRPTLAARPDGAAGYFLYAERAGTIMVATSADGLTFGAPQLVDLGFPPRDAGPAQTSVGSPGAGLQIPQVDPPRVILFFESRRADGSRTLGMAGSRDGLIFERATLPPFGTNLREGFPAPDFIDAHTTLLYFTFANVVSGRASRALTVAVSPGTLRFD
jgi:hypothetical protein